MAATFSAFILDRGQEGFCHSLVRYLIGGCLVQERQMTSMFRLPYPYVYEERLDVVCELSASWLLV